MNVHVTVGDLRERASGLREETFRIEKLVYGGDGLGRIDGQVIFTPFVAAGETVRAEISKAKNDLLRGNLLEVLEPAPERVPAACPYFARCGGCQYQHINYGAQLQAKQAILREVLRRVGKLEVEGEIGIVAAEPWQYRNRIQLHIANQRVGYFEAGSHRLCPIQECPISSPKLNQVIGLLNAELARHRTFEANIEVFTNESDVQLNVLDRIPAEVRAGFEAIGSPEPITYSGLRVGRGSFFQVNRFLIGALLETVVGPLEGRRAVELYAGVGLFSVELAKKFERVTAVESGWSAYRDLEANAPQVEASKKSAGEYLAALTDKPDVIVADPPRSGLGPEIVKELLRIGSPQLVIVSCDPATLARDLRMLTAQYAVEQIHLVDLFPQTSHLETAVRLRIKEEL